MTINFIDSSAVIDPSSVVWHFSVIMADVKIGAHCSIGSRTEIGKGSVIGDHSRIGSGVFLPYNSRVGRYVFIGPNVTCTDDRFPRVPAPADPPYTALPPILEDRCNIGAGAVILPGIRIGSGATVGAGCVVTHDVRPGALVYGVPAREHASSIAARRAGVVANG